NPSCEYVCDYDLFVQGGDVSAYEGQFLQGFSVKHAFSYEEWLERTRDKLRGQYLSVISKLAREALKSDDMAKAISLAEEYLREDPLDEEASSFLMTCHREAKQYAKAAQIYQQLKQQLADELATDPIESTSALYQEIMDEWNNIAQPASESNDASADNKGAALSALDGLDADTLRTAELISLFPQSAPCGILLKLAEQDSDNLTKGAGELLRLGLIVEESSNDRTSYKFSHQDIRDAVYGRLAVFKREPLHLKIAELLSADKAFVQNSRSCRRIAFHFDAAGEKLKALRHEINALELESSRSCEPFPILPLDGDIPYVHADVLEKEAEDALCKLSSLHGDDSACQTEIPSIENALTLIRGRIALFRGDFAKGAELLGNLSSAYGERPDYAAMTRACYMLAASAIYRQSTGLAERYSIAGMKLLQRLGDPLLTAQFQRLRACCFCLEGAYDKSSYYILEATEELEKQPRTLAARIQTAAANYDYGRLCRQHNDYAGACSHFKKAIGILGDDYYPGSVWLYVHYGRTAFAMEDHIRARGLFMHGYRLAKDTGELWGRTAAASFTAFYQAEDGDLPSAAASLADAQESAKKFDSPLEEAIMCFVSMRLRLRAENSRDECPELAELLTSTPDEYARLGIRMLAGIPDVFEINLLSKSLRDGISSRQHFRASELYSKNKNFMTE
ncbi:MAG: BTAD domain-containing putative transcriptional regulator, partial [Synergistaceae bacterium]|nr:BTAD domain-containing putative transcriptional regulator [Synergistaceae bacterium]